MLFRSKSAVRTKKIQVDGHHTVEDIGIALGQAVSKALGDKRGITRYGTFFLPMDETLAMVSLDISGRPYLVYDAGGDMAPMIGQYDTELTEEFLWAFAYSLTKGNTNIIYGMMTIYLNISITIYY